VVLGAPLGQRFADGLGVGALYLLVDRKGGAGKGDGLLILAQGV